jgi:hypothetical protein
MLELCLAQQITVDPYNLVHIPPVSTCRIGDDRAHGNAFPIKGSG